MKGTLISFSIFCIFCCSLTSIAQTAEEHVENGLEKDKQKNYKGAIKDYDKAIKADKNSAAAYFHRATAKLMLNDLKPSIADFNKTIELAPDYDKAYYNRAVAYIYLKNYAQALPDIDKVIELAPNTVDVFCLRGFARIETNDKIGACEDFNHAKEMGNKKADKYLATHCGNEQQEGESLLLHWPESENWKVGSSQENEQMALLELIPAKETLENWTEMGTMMSIKGAVGIPVENAMNMMFDQAKANAPKAQLTFIEKDETAEFPWIIFTIEAPNFKNDKNPESQLWYVVQGKTALYTNFRAVKQATVPAELKEKWIAFFKTGKIVYK